MQSVLWPLSAYAAAAFLIVGGILALSYALGPTHDEPQTRERYESGVLPTGSPHRPISIAFYLVAMLFVVFDIETVYLLSWAAAARSAGWSGFIEIGVFVLILLTALAYLWRRGALDWGTLAKQKGRGA